MQPKKTTETIQIYDDFDTSKDEVQDISTFAQTLIEEWNETIKIPLYPEQLKEEQENIANSNQTITESETQPLSSHQQFQSNQTENTDVFFRHLNSEIQTSQQVFIIDKIGEGGMGFVLLGQQKIPMREVAIKRLKKPSRLLCRLLIEEAMTMGALEHPNIIPVHAVTINGEHGPEVIMKRVQGETLKELLMGKPIDISQPQLGGLRSILNILIHVCHALEYAHSKNIYHRDIKPENIMVGEFGEIYLLDWGIALNKRKNQEVNSDNSVHIVGTPSYMAPEMLSGKTYDVTESTDVFLLGATLYEILTGKVLYSDSDLDKTLAKAYACNVPSFEGTSVPNELIEICKKALRRDISERFQHISEMRIELELFMLRIEAYRLRDQSIQSLMELEESVTRLQNPEMLPPDVYQFFSEARFGFEQALQIVENCPGCIDNLQKTLEIMTGLFLDIKDLNSAQSLIVSLPQKNEKLEKRVRKVQKYLKERLEKERKYKELEAKYDNAHSHKERMMLAKSMGIAIPLLIMCAMLYDFIYQPPVTPQRLLITMGSIFGVVVLATIIGRKTLLVNATGRRAVVSLGAGSFSFILVSLIGIKYHLEGNIVMMLDQLIVALTFACLYPTIRTAGYIASVSLGALLVSLIEPEYTHNALLILGLITVHLTFKDWSREDWGEDDNDNSVITKM